MAGAIDLCALDPDWRAWDFDLYRSLLYGRSPKSSVTRIGRPFGTVLALATTRACPVLSALFSLPPFTIEGPGILAPHDSLHSSLSAGAMESL